MGIKGYVQRRTFIGEVITIHDLERGFGIISYDKRLNRGAEEGMAPFRAGLNALKKGETLEGCFHNLNCHM